MSNILINQKINYIKELFEFQNLIEEKQPIELIELLIERFDSIVIILEELEKIIIDDENLTIDDKIWDDIKDIIKKSKQVKLNITKYLILFHKIIDNLEYPAESYI